MYKRFGYQITPSNIFPNNGHLVVSHKRFNLIELTDAQACPEHMIDVRYYSCYSILHESWDYVQTLNYVPVFLNCLDKYDFI